MSGRPGLGQKRFSRDRFQLLPDNDMAKDATIDIPLTSVSSRGQTGARKMNTNVSTSSYVPPTETPQENGEKHHNHFHIGHRRRIDARQAESPEDGTLNRMGRFYNAILNFSVITRYFIYVSPLALIIAVPIIVGATAAKDASIGGVRIVWFFTWIEVVWLSLWVAKAFAHYLPFVFQFLCGIVSSGTRKYALILKALEIPISLVGWSVTSLATFIPLMTRNPDKRAANDTGIKNWENVVKNILFAAFISSLVLAAEKVLIQLISISYHRKQFDTKIKESKHNIYLLGQLYDASRTLFPEYCKEFADEDYIISDSIMGKKVKGHNRMGSASPMKLIQNVGQNVGRVGDKITAAFGNVAHEITGKEVFNPTSSHSIVTVALERRKSSEALARRLWMSFVVQGRDALFLEDIVEVLGTGREAEAEECFAILDRDGNGDVSLEEMIFTVTEFGRVRKSISHSMHDVAQAIHVLDNLLMTVVLVLVVFIFVAFLNKGFGTTLAAGATALLSMSFVFAVTAQEVLGSCIFLFVKHPFDVGDRVDINDRPLIVERISLLFTVFRGVTDHKTTQVPNIVLNTNWIDNVTRSNAMREQLTLTADYGTSFGDIQLLKSEMLKFVLDKENSRDFQPEVDIEVIGLGEMNKLELRIEIRHKSNWSNETVRAARRSKFMCALVLALKKVPIYGPGGSGAALGDFANPSYSVAISHEQAQASKDEYKKGVEEKRMVPTDEMDKVLAELQATGGTKASGNDFHDNKSSGPGSGVQFRGASSSAVAAGTEAAFAETINQRPPAMDKGRVDESDVLRGNDPSPSRVEQNVLREPSTGRRRGGGANTPVIEEDPSPATSSSPPAASGAAASRQPVEYYEYTTPYNTGSGGRESPYQSNNPYSRSSPSPQPQQQPAPYPQAAPTGTPVASPPPPSQSPTQRRPVPPQGNGFAQREQPPQGPPPARR